MEIWGQLSLAYPRAYFLGFDGHQTLKSLACPLAYWLHREDYPCSVNRRTVIALDC